MQPNFCFYPWASLVAQMVKNLPATQPAMQETWVQSLGQEDPPEKEMQPTPVFLPGQSHGSNTTVFPAWPLPGIPEMFLLGC